MRFIIASAAILASTCIGQAAPRTKCHDAGGAYVNISGHVIPDPACVSPSVHLQGESAICRDGSHSMSEHHAGTCSHHGGVARWE